MKYAGVRAAKEKLKFIWYLYAKYIILHSVIKITEQTEFIYQTIKVKDYVTD